jgi:hypothetical protein
MKPILPSEEHFMTLGLWILASAIAVVLSVALGYFHAGAGTSLLLILALGSSNMGIGSLTRVWPLHRQDSRRIFSGHASPARHCCS